MSFTDFNFNRHISEALKSQGYVKPTPIQQQAIQPILDGRDMIGLAQTGTGKTAAFVLPILEQLSAGRSSSSVRSLIIAPTRELAEQTYAYIGKFSTRLKIRACAVYGGVSREAQINKLKRGVDIVIACPGRLLDLANDGAINLSGIEILVLDEADQMLDQGFLPDIKRIIKKLPVARQNLVFSATMPNEVRSLVDGLLVKPVEVTVDHNQPHTNISHTFYRTEKNKKNSLLTSILKEGGVDSAIVFTRTKYKAKSLAQRLEKQGFKAASIQGNLSQQQRQRALNDFKKRFLQDPGGNRYRRTGNRCGRYLPYNQLRYTGNNRGLYPSYRTNRTSLPIRRSSYVYHFRRSEDDKEPGAGSSRKIHLWKPAVSRFRRRCFRT